MANLGENLLDRSKQEFNNGEWENFVNGKLIVFMEENGLEKITVDEGCGRKGRIAKNKNGEFKIQVTFNETM